MEGQLIITNSIAIDAPAAKVWHVLTDPEQTRRYMFGCETISDWKPGSELLWRMEHEGRPFVAVKGHIKALEPGKFLSYTTIDPNNPAVADIPENYLTVHYELSEKDGKTILTVSQGDYAAVGEGRRRYDESVAGGGWSSILDAIKKQAEEA